MTEGRRAARSAVAASLIALGLAGALACTNLKQYEVYGRSYDRTRDCLSGVEFVDLLSGTDPGASCPATCLAFPATDAGDLAALFVTSECPPYPPAADAGGADPGCAKALAAVARMATCLSDGGSSNPAPPTMADAATSD